MRELCDRPVLFHELVGSTEKNVVVAITQTVLRTMTPESGDSIYTGHISELFLLSYAADLRLRFVL